MLPSIKTLTALCEQADTIQTSGFDPATAARILRTVLSPKHQRTGLFRIAEALKIPLTIYQTKTIEVQLAIAAHILTGANNPNLIYDAVAVIRHQQGFQGYWADIAAEYVNRGDTYAPTLLYSPLLPSGSSGNGGRWQVTSMGDFVERNQTRLQLC